jgi:hypothetical protein
MNNRIKLKPIHTLTCEWMDGDNKYALVGKSSQKIHAIFVAGSESHAVRIANFYENEANDSGYNLMLVEE